MILRSPQLAALDWLEHGFGTRLSPDWPPEPAYVNLRQIHSGIVIEAGEGAHGSLGEGDALVTRQAGMWIGVRTADCAPLILADPANRATAVAHAGWRGTVAGVAVRAVERMQALFGTAPCELLAAIGPAIALCCFEVGPEVARQFRAWWPERSDLDCRARIDMPGTIQRQLIASGLTPGNISVVRECTQCGSECFHSFRRDREASGRMVSAARIIP